jgi:hypothetical protein
MTKENSTRLTEEDFEELQRNFRAELYHARHRDIYYKCELTRKHSLDAEKRMKEFLIDRLNKIDYERLVKEGYHD